MRKRNSIYATKTWERQFEKLESHAQRLKEETIARVSKENTEEREKQRKRVECQYRKVEHTLVDFSSWDFELEKRNAKITPKDREEPEWTQSFMTRRDQFAARLELHLVTRQRALLDQACKVLLLAHDKERIAATNAVWSELESVTHAKTAFYRQG